MIFKSLSALSLSYHFPGAQNKGGTKEIFVKYNNEEKH